MSSYAQRIDALLTRAITQKAAILASRCALQQDGRILASCGYEEKQCTGCLIGCRPLRAVFHRLPRSTDYDTNGRVVEGTDRVITQLDDWTKKRILYCTRSSPPVRPTKTAQLLPTPLSYTKYHFSLFSNPWYDMIMVNHEIRYSNWTGHQTMFFFINDEIRNWSISTASVLSNFSYLSYIYAVSSSSPWIGGLIGRLLKYF